MMRSSSHIQQKKVIRNGAAQATSKTSVTSSVRVTKAVAKTPGKHVSKKIPSPYTKKLKRYTKQAVKSLLLSPAFHSSFKVVTVLIVSSGLIYASYFFISKTFANEVVVSQGEIVSRVGKLTALPQEAPYEIVRVQDEEDLRKQNPFYKDIKEGDYILMYKDLAVIYDLRANSIVAVKHAGEEASVR
jgi:hypothetical protein